MAKGNNRSLLLAGIAAGAYAYLSKPENREKAMEAFNAMKTKVNSFIDAQKEQKNKTEPGEPGPYDTAENKMVDEGGAMTSVKFYNEEVQEPEKESETNRKIGSETT